MCQKKYMQMEIAGIIFILAFGLILRQYHSFSPGTLSILLSTVNNSVWENAKVFIIAFIAWAAILQLAMRVPFKQFVVSKVISLYICALSAMLGYYLVYLFARTGLLWLNISLVISSICIAQFLSYRLTISLYELDKIFIPCVFMLALLFVCICCFTVFPPKMPIFLDPDTGMYGIIPDHIDIGDVFLDNLYGKLM